MIRCIAQYGVTTGTWDKQASINDNVDEDDNQQHVSSIGYDSSSISSTDSEESCTPASFWVNALDTTSDQNTTECQSETESKADVSEIGTNISITEKAMKHSKNAADFVSERKYGKALQAYTLAVSCYEMKREMKEKAALAAINSAGCYRNMSSVCRVNHDFDQVVVHLEKAEELYVQSQEHVNEFVKEAAETNQLRSSKMNVINSGNTSTIQEYVCLDVLILETLQARANATEEFLKNVPVAIDCNELILHRLLDLYDLKEWDELVSRSVRIDDVMFTPMSKELHFDLLVVVIKKLIALYQQDKGEARDLMLVEDGLRIIRQCKEESPDTVVLLTQFLVDSFRTISDLYFEREEVDDAVDALRDSYLVRLTLPGEPSKEAIDVISRMGQASEEIEDYGKALDYYETILEARTRFYGDDHREAAISLVDVARVKELLNGSSEETLELYKAANEIFLREIKLNRSSNVGENRNESVRATLQTIPEILRNGEYNHAVVILRNLLCLVDTETNNDISVSLDKAQICFDLCRAYIGMNDHEAAATCLIDAMNELGFALNDNVLKSIRRVSSPKSAEKSEKQNETNTLSNIESSSCHIFSDEVDDPTLANPDISACMQSDLSGATGTICNIVKIDEPAIEEPVIQSQKPKDDSFDDMAWLHIHTESNPLSKLSPDRAERNRYLSFGSKIFPTSRQPYPSNEKVKLFCKAASSIRRRRKSLHSTINEQAKTTVTTWTGISKDLIVSDRMGHLQKGEGNVSRASINVLGDSIAPSDPFSDYSAILATLKTMPTESSDCDNASSHRSTISLCAVKTDEEESVDSCHDITGDPNFTLDAINVEINHQPYSVETPIELRRKSFISKVKRASPFSNAKRKQTYHEINIYSFEGEIDCLSDTCSVKPNWLNPSISRRLPFVFPAYRSREKQRKSAIFRL